MQKMQNKQVLEQLLAHEHQLRVESERELKSLQQKVKALEQELLDKENAFQKRLRLVTDSLRQSELAYRQMVEAAGDLVCKFTPLGKVTYINQQGCIKLGRRAAEVLNEDIIEFLPPAWRDSFWRQVRQQMEDRDLCRYYQVPFLSKDQRFIWTELQVSLILEESNILELACVAKDITEQKQAEEKLKRTQTRLSALIKNLHSGALVKNEEDTVILANEMFCHIFRMFISPEWLIGKSLESLFEHIHKVFAEEEAFLKWVQTVRHQKQEQINQAWALKDGRVLRIDYVPIFEEGQFLGSLWNFRDVTEEEKAQETIRANEEKYRTVIQRMQLGLIELDGQGRVTDVNERLCTLTGYEPEEFIGKDPIDILVPEKNRERARQLMQQGLAAQLPLFELKCRKKNGELFWAMVSLAPRHDLNGNVIGTISALLDITPQKRLLKELESARQAAEEARQAEKLFLANMSHEIRTPLNAVIGMVHLLSDTKLNKRQQAYLSTLKSSANILLNLISDILDISKIESGKVEVQKREFDLNSLVRNLERTFRMKVENKPVEVCVEVDPAIRTLYLGDDLMLNQILLNLLSNAEKFTEKGKFGLRIELLNKAGQRVDLKFEVFDTGIGIAKDRLVHIFNNFEQASEEIKYRYGGTGLGLAITKRLVELQGGSIHVESEPGKGTTFTIYLSYTDTGKKAVAVDEERMEDVAFHTANFRVLIAEDNYMNRQYISELLQKWGITHDLAHHGKEALQLAAQHPYSLIFMDLQMPFMDGIEATRRLRASEGPNARTPIIALTASALTSRKNEALDAGMNDFLPKPFSPNQLRKLLNTYAIKGGQTMKETAKEQHFRFNEALDTNYLEFFYEGDLDYAADIFETFLDVTLPEFRKLRPLAQQAHWTAFRKLAHKLKPNFLMVGLSHLSAQLEKLEDIQPDAQTPVAILGQLDQLEKEVEEYIPVLRSELERMKRTLKTVTPQPTPGL